MTVVDFGCGPGYFTVELAKHARKVITVDVQADMLKKARRKRGVPAERRQKHPTAK